jgi:hypothetical protein
MLRVGLSLACFTLGFFFTCFWARSKAYLDEFSGGFHAEQRIWGHTTSGGLMIHIEERPNPLAPRWLWRTWRFGDKNVVRGPRFPWEYNKMVLGFARHIRPRAWSFAVPYWFLTLAFFTLAVLLTPPPRWRFSLRRLLAVITLAAVVLGIMATLPNRSGPV